MFLTSLHLANFRNYHDQIVNFNGQKTILLGNNAQGKSNLLESVELLSTLKSHRIKGDRDLILQGENIAQIKANLQRLYSNYELGIIFRLIGGKDISLNGETIKKQTHFIGVLNTVEFSSLDLDLVRGAPEFRRSWIDNLLIQIEPIYDYILHNYNHILRQRNYLLKQMRIGQNHRENDELQLTLWNKQLSEAGSRVTRRRARAINLLAPIAEKWHNNISGNTEVLMIKYSPNVTWSEDNPEKVQQAFLEKLAESETTEINQGSTIVGPHRDEIELIINETLARFYGSQGQQRTLVLALKLAELELIETVVGEPPVLLLDDVLAELDPYRQNQLLETIGDRFQTLITTTHLSCFDANWLKNSQILSVERGKISNFATKFSR
jgi:DNA replication and repair protein RecF